MTSSYKFEYKLDTTNFQLTELNLLGLINKTSIKDDFLKESYPTIFDAQMLNKLRVSGLCTTKKNTVIQIHPLLSFQLKKQLNTKGTMVSIQQKYHHIFLNKAAILQPKLQIQDKKEMPLLMAKIQLDLANYYWVGLKTALILPSFIEIFNTITDYWIYYAQYEQVIHYAQKIVLQFEKIDKNELEPAHQLAYLKVQEIKGYALYSLGKHKKAETIYVAILKAYNHWKLKDKNELVLGRIYQNLGIIYRILKDHNKAKAYLKEALQIFHKYGETASEASVMQNYGNLLLTLNQFSEALEIYQDALPIFEKIGESYSQAEIHQNMGLVYRKLKQFDASNQYYQKALTGYIQFKDIKGQAQIYQNLGVLNWDKRLFRQAIDYYKMALNIYIPLNAYHQQGKIYQNLGVAYRNLNELVDSLTYYEKAAAIYLKINDQHTYGRVRFNMGVVKWRQQLYLESEQHLKAALSIFETFNDNNQVGNVYLNLGVLYNSWGKETESQTFSQNAISILKENKNYAHASRAALNIGAKLGSQNKPKASNDFFKEGLAIAKLANDTFTAGIICKNMAKNFVQLGQPETAISYIKVARKALSTYPKNKHQSEIKELAEQLYTLTKDETLLDLFD